MSDIYDRLFAEEDSRRKATVREAMSVKPDEFAAQKRDAAVLGVPQAAVAADPTTRQDAYARLIEDDLNSAPTLRKRLGEADFAKLSHDDVSALKTVEGYVANMAREAAGATDRGQTVLRSVPAGVARLSAGLYGVAGTAAEAAAPLLDPLARLTGADNPLRTASDFLGRGYRAASATADRIAAPIERGSRDDTMIGRAMQSGAESVGQTFVSLPLGVISAGTRAGQAGLVAQSAAAGGGSAMQAREQGVSAQAALYYGAGDAVFEFAGEKAGFKRLVEDTLRGTGIFKTVARQLVPEVIGENATTALQDLNAWALLPQNKDKTFGDYLAERPAAAAETTLATLFGVGGNAAVSRALGAAADRVAGQQRDALVATEDADKLMTLMSAAATSKLRGRDADTFAQLVQQAAEDRPGVPARLYVDAAVLLGDGQRAGLVTRAELAQLVPGVSAQEVDDALATGGALELPIGDVAARVAGTPLEQKLLDHVRTTPDGMSKSEAKEIDAKIADLSKLAQAAVEETSDAVAIEGEREAVRQNLLGQLASTKRFTPDVNEVYARLAADFFTTMAARSGMTPQQLYARYPLSIEGASVLSNEPRVFNQSAASAAPGGSTFTDKTGAEFSVSVSRQAFGAKQTEPNSVLVEVRDPATGERRGFVDFSIRPDGVLTSENTRVAKSFNGRGIAAAMYKAARDAGYDIAPGKVQTDDGLRMVAGLQKKGLINKDADGPRFRAGDLDLVPLDGVTLAQPARGTFNPGTLKLSLLENADLSTFVHEMGHFALEVMADLAAQPQAPAGVAGDMAALLRWFGVKTGDNTTALDTWRAMTLDQKREHHERFAEAFEQYMFEGKAPTHDLQALFAKVRSWMTGVYRSLKEFLAGKDKTLTPSVRGVFDRMLASEDAIAEAQQVDAYAPLFKDAAQAGMSNEEFEKYLALGQQATDNAVSALAARSLRDMRWVANARAKALAAEQKRVEGLRKATEKEIRAELEATPVERARAAIRALQREELKASAAAKEQRAGWTAEYKVAEAESREAHKDMPTEQRKLQVQQDMLQWELTNPAPQPEVDAGSMQIVAEANGFRGVDEMSKALAGTPAIEQELEGRVDRRLLEQYGDTTTTAGMKRAADEAVHNEARSRFIATGLRALTDGRAGVNVLMRAAKQFAANLVGDRPIRSLSVQKFKAAEARAGKAALEATAKGDTRRAIAETRSQMLNNQLVRTASAAVEEVEKGVKYLRTVGDSSTIDPDYRDQIDALLERFDLKEVSGPQAEKRKALAAWIDEQRTYGIEPDLPPEIVSDTFRKPYRDMTVDQFRGLVAAVRQIEHLGRLKNKLLTAKDDREFQAVRDAMAASIIDNAKGRTADTRSPATRRGQAKRAAKKFGAGHLKVSTIAYILDGGKDGGLLWEYIIRPANERADFETARVAKATRELTAILKPWLDAGKPTSETFFPSVNRSLTREQVLSIALNTGNDGNLQRLLGGENWTMVQIEPVLQTLTREDWATVQKVWDHLESYRAEVGAKQKRVYGTEPDWVAPAARTHTLADGTTVDVRGGYYPIKYDPLATARASELAADEEAERMKRGAHNAATTRRSFTKARSEEVTGRPLLYSLSTLTGGVGDVIHDLAWHEWLIDTNRMLGRKGVGQLIRETYGPEIVEQLETWRRDIAEGPRGAAGTIDAAASLVRQSVSLAGLGYNMMTAATQVLGFTNTVSRIGVKATAAGLTKYLAAPLRSAKEVRAKSVFMAERSTTFNRELNDLKNRVRAASTTLNAVREGAYVMLMKVQSTVDIPTWIGAYDKAILADNSEERAIALADQAVRSAQGNGAISDLSEIERGGGAQKLFTSFYSYFNTVHNLIEAQRRTPGRGNAAWVSHGIMLTMLPAVLMVILREVLVAGDGSGEEELAQKMIEEGVASLFSTMVGVRELTGAAKMLAGASKQDYQGPAGLRALSVAFRGAGVATDGELDAKDLKAAVNVLGLIGLPSAQINRTIAGADALIEGDTENPAALLFGYQEPR
jgi:predicted GNAT family acetyltransferase